MELYVQINNNETLRNLESLLFSKAKDIGVWFARNMPWEVYENLSPEYEIQVNSASKVNKLLVKTGNAFNKIMGFYYWSDQCEFLMPTLSETKKAIELIKDFDKKYPTHRLKEFALVIPYYWNETIRKRIQENLEWLNENAKHINKQTGKIEIIINSFWLLQLLKGKENLVPVLGRLLLKTLKRPLVDTQWIEKGVHIPWVKMKNKNQEEINAMKKEIAKNQMKEYDNAPISNPYFLSFMEKYNIHRLPIENQEIFKNIYTNIAKNNTIVDIYYPYSRVFVGRLCDTGAIDNIKRGYYPIDAICPRTCKKFQMKLKNIETAGYHLIQKGNAQYKSQINIELPEEITKNDKNRLIYWGFL